MHEARRLLARQETLAALGNRGVGLAHEPNTPIGNARLELLKQGQDLELVVANDGCGLDAAHRDRVFEPFFTTRFGQGGSGLGLHLAHQLAPQCRLSDGLRSLRTHIAALQLDGAERQAEALLRLAQGDAYWSRRLEICALHQRAVTAPDAELLLQASDLLTWAEREGDAGVQAAALLTQAIVMRRQRRFGSALQQARRARQLFEQLPEHADAQFMLPSFCTLLFHAERYAELIQVGEAELDRSAELSDRFEAVAGLVAPPEASESRQQDLTQLLRKCPRAYASRLRAQGVRLGLQLPPSLGCEGHAETLEQVLNQLLENLLPVSANSLQCGADVLLELSSQGEQALRCLVLPHASGPGLALQQQVVRHLVDVLLHGELRCLTDAEGGQLRYEIEFPRVTPMAAAGRAQVHD